MITHLPAGGTGLLMLLCNLDAQWHAPFRAWLVEDMFPARCAIGFGACASYDRAAASDTPLAQRYLTLYEAPALGDLYAAPYQSLRDHRDPRDAAFHARFRDLYRATASWIGPELRRSAVPSSDEHGANVMAGAPVPFAPFVALRSFAVPAANVARFNQWYVGAYLPACAQLAPLLRLRRYAIIEAAPARAATHLLLHELTDAALLEDRRWRDLCAHAAWSWTVPELGADTVFKRVVAYP